MDIRLSWIKRLLILCLLPLGTAFAEPTVIRDFTCGKVDTEDPTLIGEGCAQELQNVDVWRGRIQKRRGSILQNSTDLGGFSNQPVKFLHEFPDQNGNFWLISFSSNSLFTSDDGGASNSLLTSTFGITATSEFSAANAFGKAYLTDGTTNFIVYDGNTLISSTAPPKGKLVAFMFGRLWVADITGERSTLYYSRINEPNDWTDNDTDDGDSSSLFIRENDGYYIRAIIPFRNSLLIFKDYSIDSLTMGTDGLTPIVTPISNSVGTQHRRSVTQTDNSVIFVGADAIYEYTGSALRVISDGIDTTFESILQRNSTSRSYTLTSQSDFAQGTFQNTDSDVLPHSLVLSTWTTLQTSSTNFAAGTSVNIDTFVVVGSIRLSTTNTNVENYSFENGTGDDADNWSEYLDGPGRRATNVAHDVGVYSAYIDDYFTCGSAATYFYIDILDYTNNILQTFTYNYSAFTQNAWTLSSGNSLAAYAGRVIKFKLRGSYTASNSSAYMASDPFIASGNDFVFYGYQQTVSGGQCRMFLDDLAGGRSLISSGTYISSSFDTGISSPSWMPSTYTAISNAHSVAVYTQSSVDGTTWESSQTWTSGSAPTSAPRRYIRYQVNFSTTSNGVFLPSVSDVTLNARSLSGDYLSPAISLGTNINSWGAFSASDQSNGGTISYTLYTDTNTSISTNSITTYLSSQTVTNGQVPMIATASYAFFYSTMSIQVSTYAPQVDSLQIAWNEGASNFPIWGTFFEHEYHAAVSTSTTANNDTILVFDPNRAWTIYSGFYPYVLTRYRQSVYYGDATRGRIYRYNVDDVYSDNGTAIDARWRSKEFDFGAPASDKTVTKYSIMAKRQVGTTVNFNYGVNRGAYTTSSLDLGSVAGAFRKFLVPSSDTYRKGVTHSFSFTNNSVNQPFDILSISIYPRLETDPL